MLALLKKEIRSFFTGPVAYLVLSVFFIANTLMLFVFPSDYNLLESGYASMQPYFRWLPWMCLLFIPALGMKSFAEEKKTGTIEVLLTRPVSDLSLVLSKFLASYIIFLLALLPTLCYVCIMAQLAAPTGNLDYAAFWGGFVGLALLGACFTAVCIWASTLSDHQIMAFIFGIALSSASYIGWDLLARLISQGETALFFSYLGLFDHYQSLSRGVIDFSDVVFFLSFIALFILLAYIQLAKRFSSQKKLGFGSLAILVLINAVFAFVNLRIDLTQDQRYTLTPFSKTTLKENPEPVLVRVYLSGNLPAGFKKLENSIRETLDEFRRYNSKIQYEFIDVYSISNSQKQQAYIQELLERGLEATQLEIKTKEGMSRRLIFPSAEISARGKSVRVSLLSQAFGMNSTDALNNSIENIEPKLITAFISLFNTQVDKIAFLYGHGELDLEETSSIGNDLSSFYRMTRLDFSKNPIGIFNAEESYRLPNYRLLIIANPQRPFSAEETFFLDQYMLRGGRCLFLSNAGNMSMDSLQKYESCISTPLDLNLQSLFFRYGFRINPVFILDANCCATPVITSYIGNRPQIELLPNPYTPLLSPCGAHPLWKDVNHLRSELPASIDTIESPLKKTPVLFTSDYSKVLHLPYPISADLMREPLQKEGFLDGKQCIGLLTEGIFPSGHRGSRPAVPSGFQVLQQGEREGKIFVAGDGKMIRNRVLNQQILPLGFDPYTGEKYDQSQFFTNTVHYLCDRTSWSEIKPKTLKIRMLDRTKTQTSKTKYQILSLVVPCLLTLSFGIFIHYRRKRF